MIPAPLLLSRCAGSPSAFPASLANDDVSFEAAAGEVHALLGENGAGKSTLSNILTGLYRPDAGEIRLDGELVDFQSPSDAIDAGIGMVHQHFRLVPVFTVAENVILGEHRERSSIHPREIERRWRNSAGDTASRSTPARASGSSPSASSNGSRS